jgi:ATP-dependent DNA helicase RecG
MKSKKLNTNSLNWDSSILELSPSSKSPSKNLQKIYNHGINSIKDLIWILPLRVQSIPKVQDFSKVEVGLLFKGSGKVININLSPVMGRSRKSNVQLFNITVLVKDLYSSEFINLKWFNAYPSIKKQLEELDEFIFMGTIQTYNESLQIINPKLNPKEESSPLLIEYPTVNKVPGSQLKKIIQKIPLELWENQLHFYSNEFESFLSLTPMNEAFKTLHGVTGIFSQDHYQQAVDRIIYDEFIKDQLKVTARKMAYQSLETPKIEILDSELNKFQKVFPYSLTEDQNKVLEEIREDFKSGHIMMRIIQGDVGCGKTTVAMLATAMIVSNQGQVAIMCPTEALAIQHKKTFDQLFGSFFSIHLLVGSTKAKDKKLIYSDLINNKIQILIGTHSLFQDQVKFKNLRLTIIDEQHKFGVEQRLKLVNKGHNTHCLLMSATPIPRTLQLAQYGDLNISTIKTIPAGRKGTQTRIVTDKTYEKYLSFLKTRVSLGEQAYIVVPAITESEKMDMKNVESHVKIYKNIYPDLRVSALHGQLASEEKLLILESFEKGNIDILISTSVIEVGINVLNASLISIYDPERFGLSSLHQLRGRVGRGHKAGFCFLIPDEKVSRESINRLNIIEKSNDGFLIAEADLKNRGEGDLFGTNQSGNVASNHIASIFEHFHIFEKVKQDIELIKKENPQLLSPLISILLNDKKISTTI